jgi:hypothetical protein
VLLALESALFAEGDLLFVSLGSNCAPAHVLRDYGQRTVAFPFDWVVSADTGKLIELLEDDFRCFFDERFLHKSSNGWAHLLYQLTFPHDPQILEDFKDKYQRRISRFRELNQYPGQVTFLRFASPYFPEYSEISHRDALRLDQALRSYFPDLRYRLLILNFHDRTEIEQVELLSERISIHRFNPRREGNTPVFNTFFQSLISSSASQDQ